MRDAIVGQLMRYRTDKRGLAVSPAGPFDASPRSRAGAAPIRTDTQPGAQGFAGGERQRDAGEVRVLRDHFRAIEHVDLRIGAHRIHQRTAEVAVLYHMTHRAFLDLGMIEVHEKR